MENQVKKSPTRPSGFQRPWSDMWRSVSGSDLGTNMGTFGIAAAEG